MKKIVMKVLYLCSIVLPIIDFTVGTIRGVCSSVKNFKSWLNQYTADKLNKQIGKDLNQLEFGGDDNEYLMNKALTERAIKKNIIDPKDL